MEQLTLEQAAHSYAKKIFTGDYTSFASFKAGAEWQKEQNKRVLELLKGIANWGGNLPNERLQTRTGPNDAALRGGLVCDMRDIAVEAIRIFEPEYKPDYERLQD